MLKLDTVKKNLKPGKLYRRSDLEKLSTSVDRHVAELVKQGTLKKVGPGLYLRPAMSKWGEVPSDDKDLVRAFLKDDRFLVFSFNNYNGLGLGTTQLYNHTVVYNHKRHGQFKLGNRVYDFRMKPDFPVHFTREDLLVDMLNNLSELAEDGEKVYQALKRKVSTFDESKLDNAAKLYGKVKTKKIIKELLHGKKVSSSRQ
jgi:hypothetical protein